MAVDDSSMQSAKPWHGTGSMAIVSFADGAPRRRRDGLRRRRISTGTSSTHRSRRASGALDARGSIPLATALKRTSADHSAIWIVWLVAPRTSSTLGSRLRIVTTALPPSASWLLTTDPKSATSTARNRGKADFSSAVCFYLLSRSKRDVLSATAMMHGHVVAFRQLIRRWPCRSRLSRSTNQKARTLKLFAK